MPKVAVANAKSDKGVVPSKRETTMNDKNEPVDISYIKVVDDEGDDAIEIPLEPDGHLLLSSVTAQFPGASGLKFRAPSGAFRGLRLDESGRINPPSADNGWGDTTYIAVFPKENTKRKMDDHVDAIGAGATKLKRVERRKCSDLIVLGLPFTTTDQELREYFEQFGEVVSAQIKKDFNTHKSRGYGFIRFSDYDVQMKAMGQRHNIDGRWCDARIPNSKQSGLPPNRKIFVGRLTEDMEQKDIEDCFSKFGEVTDIFIPKPFRGFAFVTFAEASVAEALCGEEFEIKGVSVMVNEAVPKESGHAAFHAGQLPRSGGEFSPFGSRPFRSAAPPPHAPSFYDERPPSYPAPSMRDEYYSRMSGGPPRSDNYFGTADGGAGIQAYSRYYDNGRGDHMTPQKMGKIQPWSSGVPPTAGGFNMDGGYGMSAGMPQERSHTPQQHYGRQPPPPSAAGQPSVTTGRQGTDATQAAAAIGALNLNNLLTPRALAMAHVALLKELASSAGGAVGGSDFTALLSNLQMDSGSAGGNQGGGRNPAAAANWWPNMTGPSTVPSSAGITPASPNDVQAAPATAAPPTDETWR